MKYFLLSFLFLSAAVIAADAPEKGGLFTTADAQPGRLILTPGSNVMDSRIFLNNRTAGAVIPDSKDWHLTDKGFTVAATIRLNRRYPNFGSGYGADGKFLYDHDIIVSKGNEFVFGRRSDRWCDQLYLNFARDGKWSVPLIGTVAIPPYESYAHVAVTVQRSVVDFRGFDGYVATYYVNGEPEKIQQINCGGAVTFSQEPWRLGSGLGVRNDHWSFGGEMTDVFLADRALSEQEVMKLAASSKSIKIADTAGCDLNPALEKEIRALEKQASSVGKWALSAVERSARGGTNQTQLRQELEKVQQIVKISDSRKFVQEWNAVSKNSRILASQRSLLFVNTGKHRCGFPIAGWFDLKRGEEIFGVIPPAWELNYHALKEKQPMKQSSLSTAYEVKLESKRDAAQTGTIEWNSPGQLKAVSRFIFRNDRLEMDLQVNALSQNVLLDNVTFPMCRLRKLRKGTDRLLYPKMSGVVFEKPIIKEVPQPWRNYPNGELNMQFHAYYDDLGGIYFASEDPYGGMKNFSTRGRRNELDMRWTHPVAYPVGQSGGKEFTLSGKGTWELFDGDWYDAGRIYRRFLAQKAKWWIPELPRKSTPQWMRENTLWILQLCFNEWDWYNTVANLKELRNYFELPFGLHYYEWFDLTCGNFPHFYAKRSALLTAQELSDAGIYIKPYTDNRTWCRHDGLAPGKDHKDSIGFYKAENGRYDFQFSAIAEKNATRSRENELTLEGSGIRCAVMCPAVPEWQNYIYTMAKRLAGQGFHAIYHDEVTTAQPIPCFNPNHGHLLNDPRNWLEHGYWKMFEKIAALRAKYPNLCHDSEDASEPYMQYLDGVCPFRWVDPGQVPLFVSIYSGRTQFNGRLYDHVKPGEKESFYDKMAVQLVNSEQMGWFTADFMNDPDRRLFTKKMMHLRFLMLDYFNGGEMLHPLKFQGGIPERTVLWGCLTAQKIRNPKVHHCVFAQPNGLQMVLLVNASPDTVTVRPELPVSFGKVLRSSERLEKPEKYDSASPITIPPRSFEILVASSDEEKAVREAERVHQGVMKIRQFVPGKLRFEKMSEPQELSEDGVLHYSFDDLPVWHTQPAYRGEGCYELIGHPIRQRIASFNLKLEPDTAYEVSIAIRKDLDTSGILRICNYDSRNKISHYAVFGDDVPADGRWHFVRKKFRTDAKVNRCALYLYLEPTVHTLRIDELTIRKDK